MILLAAVLAVLAAMVLAVVRAVRGPTLFDRMLAGNSTGTLAILLLACLGFLNGRPAWLDIGLTYALLNVISTLAVLKFFRHGDLAHDVEGDER
jgi:multicomponent Na+:H+ antiporter subunit F